MEVNSACCWETFTTDEGNPAYRDHYRDHANSLHLPRREYGIGRLCRVGVLGG